MRLAAWAAAALQQPDNRDPARAVLERLSGEQHDTPGAWQEGLARQAR